MRFKINFKTDFLPLGYNMCFVGIIKECLKKIDKTTFHKYYGDKGKPFKTLKDFTFSIKLNDFLWDKNSKNDPIPIRGSVDMFFSTSNNNLGQLIFNYMNKKKNGFTYKNYKLFVNSVVLLDEYAINTNEVYFKTMSPIIIKDVKNKPITFENKEAFNNELNYIANIILESTRGTPLKQKLIFEPVDMKKIVIKESLTKFKNKNNENFLYLNGSKGIFKLIGDINDLNYLCKTGLSFRRSQGFGMIKVYNLKERILTSRKK